MKKTANRILTVLLTTLSLTSCGLMEMDTEELVAVGMSLGRDSLYIMVGDQLELTPVFTPDTVTQSGILWTTSDDDILAVSDGVFTALRPGWAQVRAENISYMLEDSCMVCVMPRWETTGREYPYEMLVYADVTVGGQPFNPETMMLAAFVDDELRGTGQLMEWKGKNYVRFRVGSEMRGTDSGGNNEEVSFRVYYRRELRYAVFPQSLEYDGEAHGTLSNLYKLSI